MLKRPTFVIGLALVVVLTGAGVAIGKAWTSAGSRVNFQHVEHRTADVFTDSKKWQPLPTNGRESNAEPCTDELCGTAGPSAITVISKRAMSVTVSIDVRGGPVEIRVVGTRAFRPAKARFKPRSGDTSRSFTFVSKGTKRFQCNSLSLQWRSTAGGEIESKRGSLSMSYQRPTDPPDFGCE